MNFIFTSKVTIAIERFIRLSKSSTGTYFITYSISDYLPPESIVLSKKEYDSVLKHLKSLMHDNLS